MQSKLHKLIKKVVPKKTIRDSEKALEFYDVYRDARDILDRTEQAMGKKVKYTTAASSTIHHTYKTHGIISTQNF